MSDVKGGDGWWQASDGKWYPPEEHPDRGFDRDPPRRAVDESAEAAPSPAKPPVAVGPLVASCVGSLAAILLAFVLLFGGDDGSSSAGEGPSFDTDAEFAAAMLTAAEIGPAFEDLPFQADRGPVLCGGPDRDSWAPPSMSVGSRSASDSAGALFEQEGLRYTSAEDAGTVMSAYLTDWQCRAPTYPGSDVPVTVTGGPYDRSSSLSVPTDAAYEIDYRFETGDAVADIQFFVVQRGRHVLTFTWEVQDASEPAPDALSQVVAAGVRKALAG